MARATYVNDHGLTTGALFPGKESKTGHPAANTLRDFKCYAEDKVGETFDLRICRRTYGQRMINYGVSIEWVSKFMGHASALTTERYYGSLSNSMAVQGVTEMIENRSRKMCGEGVPLIGFIGFGNIGALIGGYLETRKSKETYGNRKNRFERLLSSASLYTAPSGCLGNNSGAEEGMYS